MQDKTCWLFSMLHIHFKYLRRCIPLFLKMDGVLWEFYVHTSLKMYRWFVLTAAQGPRWRHCFLKWSSSPSLLNPRVMTSCWVYGFYWSGKRQALVTVRPLLSSPHTWLVTIVVHILWYGYFSQSFGDLHSIIKASWHLGKEFIKISAVPQRIHYLKGSSYMGGNLNNEEGDHLRVRVMS